MGGCGTRRIELDTGPTLTLTELVRKVNENNQALPTLFARHSIQADVYDPQRKKLRFISADGDLYVRKPHEMLIRGDKDIAGRIFEMGTDTERYWFTVYQNEDTEWWGWNRNAGKPCAREMPIQPELVGEVLGIGNINANLLQPPVPTLRFNPELRVYMLVWSAPLADRWYAQKEVWYDRRTLLPLKVLLFDQNGRIVLVANLTQHQPVKIPDVPEDKRPKIASHYDLFFPENKSRMIIQLSDMALTSKAGQPKEGVIRFREDPKIRPERVIQIDKDCEK